MPTIWGYLENVNQMSSRFPHIQLRTLLSGGEVIRIRAYIGPQTLSLEGTMRLMCQTCGRTSACSCRISKIKKED